MRFLIVCRITSFQSEKVYDLPKIWKPALESILNLHKDKDWKVDIFMLNYHKYPPDIPLQFDWIYESMPAFLEIARKIALEGGYDYLFIVEPDIVLPKDTLIEFLKVSDWDIITGIYPERPSKVGSWSNRRGQPPNGWLICMPWNRNPQAEKSIAERKSFIVTGCAGFGCVLLRRKAFMNISFPSRDRVGNGPDFGFYEDARNKNLNILCCPNIRCGHIENDGTIIEGPE